MFLRDRSRVSSVKASGQERRASGDDWQAGSQSVHFFRSGRKIARRRIYYDYQNDTESESNETGTIYSDDEKDDKKKKKNGLAPTKTFGQSMLKTRR